MSLHQLKESRSRRPVSRYTWSCRRLFIDTGHGADGIEAIELWIEVHTYFGNKANLILYYVDIVPFIFCLEAPKSVHKSVTVQATASPTVAASVSRADFPTHSHSRKLTLSSPNLARIQLAPARRQGSPNLHIRRWIKEKSQSSNAAKTKSPASTTIMTRLDFKESNFNFLFTIPLKLVKNAHVSLN